MLVYQRVAIQWMIPFVAGRTPVTNHLRGPWDDPPDIPMFRRRLLRPPVVAGQGAPPGCFF